MILHADSVLPCQLLHERAFSPEKRLLLAIVEDAVKVAIQTPPSDATVAALRWVHSRSRELFGFHYVCEHLNLDPSALRASILRLAGVRLRFHRTPSSYTSRKVRGRPELGLGYRWTRGRPRGGSMWRGRVA